jgi:hypothetical protein
MIGVPERPISGEASPPVLTWPLSACAPPGSLLGLMALGPTLDPSWPKHCFKSHVSTYGCIRDYSFNLNLEQRNWVHNSAEVPPGENMCHTSFMEAWVTVLLAVSLMLMHQQYILNMSLGRITHKTKSHVSQLMKMWSEAHRKPNLRVPREQCFSIC